MSQVTVHLDEGLDKAVGVVKSIYGLPSKDKAIQFMLQQQAEEVMERELRPEYVAKILAMEKKASYKTYSSIGQFKEEIERAAISRRKKA